MLRRRALSLLADLIWPPQSLLSEKRVARSGTIEAELWRGLHFFSPPWCNRCGLPLPQDEGPDAICAACAADPPAFDKARAALAYESMSARLVLDIKRGGRRDGLATFGAWMRAAGAELLAEADCLIPAPLHWSRLARRHFNQAAWLAQAVGKPIGKPVLLGALKRVKARRSQEGLTRRQRLDNVRAAYRCAAPKRVAGKIVVIVDDVFTTGATLEACARALTQAKPKAIYCLTLARVVKPLQASI